MLVYVLKKKKKKKKEDMQHMTSGTHTINWSHQPCVDVTPPPGSAPSHRPGLEPGFPAREAGALTKNAKGYSL